MNYPFRIIVIGASSGGVEALKTLVQQLPADIPAALFVVIHISAQQPSLLAHILDCQGPLPVVNAADGARIAAGHIYVAVPDRHLLIDGDVMRLSRGPKENRFRPSIDALFRSSAYSHGRRVVGVVLTGQLDDGTSGLWAIKDRGGVTIVQSPKDAQFPSMPMSALQQVDIDHVVDMDTLPGLLTQLAYERLAPPSPTENETAADAWDLRALAKLIGPKRHLLGDARETLLAELDESIDDSLWGVFRTMQEQATLLREAASRAGARNAVVEANVLASRATDCEEESRTIRALLQDFTARRQASRSMSGQTPHSAQIES